jgi:hypothetical protein
MSGFKITSIHAYVAVDPEDGDEGIMAFSSGLGMLPMIAADKTRLDELRPTAEMLAKQGGIEVRLVRFDVCTVVEVLNPQHGTCPECGSVDTEVCLWPCDDGPNEWHNQ